MLHVFSTCVLLLVALGLFFRKRSRTWHLRLMTAAFLTDLSLVIWIESTRHAVEKVATGTRVILWIHALISLGVLACYVTMILLGRGILRGKSDNRTLHRNVGLCFITLRLLNYFTAFAV